MKKNQKQRGNLIKWKDDKGFGFIKPDRGTQEVFIHISALKKTIRRPKVGDIIFYELTTDAQGKTRATNAEILGVPSATPNKKQNLNNIKFLRGLLMLPVIIIVALVGIEFRKSDSPPPITSVLKPECKIKGNISQNSGNKIYHVPGAEDYESTIIDPEQGERWFCTEAEAINNGWKKAPR